MRRDPTIQVDHDTVKVQFEEAFMYMYFMKGLESVYGLKYSCKRDKGNNKYWALRREQSHNFGGEYTCIQV